MAKSINAALPFLFLVLCWSTPLLAYWLVEADYPIFFLHKLSPDEFQYWQEIDSLQLLISQSDFFNFIFFKEKFGYGTLYWQTYAFFSYPFRALSLANDGHFILVLRSINLFFQLLTAYLLVKTHNKWSTNLRSLWTFVLTIAFMPGLLIMWKGYSPDYLCACFLAASIYFASCYLENPKSSKKPIYVAALFIGLSISIKIYMALFMGVFVLLAFTLMSTQQVKIKHKRFKLLLVGLLFSFLGLLLGNLRLLSDPSSFMTLISVFSNVVNSNDYVNAMPFSDSYLARLLTWFSNSYSSSYISMSSVGVLREFFGLPAFVIICFGALSSILELRLSKELSDIKRFVFLLFFSSLIVFFVTILITNRVWSWYLINPVLILVLTTNWIIWNSKKLFKNDKHKKIFYVFLFITHVISMGFFSLKQYQQKMDETKRQLTLINAEYKSCVMPFLKKTNFFQNGVEYQSYGFPIKVLYIPYGFPISVNQYVNVYTHDVDTVNIFSTAKYIFLKGDLITKISNFEQDFKVSRCLDGVYYLERKDL